jgi:hypothetical protein
VPQFHLRRFANARGQLRVYKSGTAEQPHVASVRDAAEENGFYRADVQPGGDPEGVEKLLARIDTLAKDATGRILAGRFPPSAEDRSSIATFLDFQLVRTPESRRIHSLREDTFLKLSMRGLDRGSSERSEGNGT